MAAIDASIAINRFGLGARPDEPPPVDPRGWLRAQFERYDPRPPAIAAAPTSGDAAAKLVAYRSGRAAMADGAATTEARMPGKRSPKREARLAALREQRAIHVAAVGARASAALATATPFVERLVHFWANHFAVSADTLGNTGLAGAQEFEAVRPHVLGRFADLLQAVERHPAMLVYLDQAGSFGPNSPAGQRIAARGGKPVGLNENLARETLELHTLGVKGGYSQADVTELARALTGRTVARIGAGRTRGMTRAEAPGAFAFLPQLHEPGDRTVLGRRYPAGGVAQGEAVLAELAVHPATARHLCTKLARHFAGDAPPPALVARLETAFTTSHGDLPSVYAALVAAPEAWVPVPVKFKTPWEWTLSTLRALGVRAIDGEAIVGITNQLGQPVWRPRQPAGYDDTAAGWIGPDAVMRRVEAAERLVARAPSTLDARALAGTLYPAALSPATEQALARADSPGQALALLLVAPESLRR